MSLRPATPRLLALLPSLPRPRPLSTAAPTAAPSQTIYENPRRLRSLSLTLLAGGQATFWASAAHLSHHAAEPLLPAAYLYSACALSAFFAALVATHLRRSVARLDLVGPARPALLVTTHGLAGLLAAPVRIPPKCLVAGPAAHDLRQRYWTFADARSRIRLFYVLDRARGVRDADAVAAVVRGGEHLLAYTHKRDAAIMKQRWQHWRETAVYHPPSPSPSPSPPHHTPNNT